MATIDREPTIPRDRDELIEFHFDISHDFDDGVIRIGDAFGLTFGEDITAAAMRALILESLVPSTRQEVEARIGKLGWREVMIELLSESVIDSVDLTYLWGGWGAEYAGQGIAPNEPRDHPPTLEDREDRIKTLIEKVRIARTCGSTIFGNRYDFILEGVEARAAIDFGGTVTIEGLRLLSGVSLAAVRNAANSGELHPDEDGRISAEEARAWLVRRREFCPSRWKHLDDDQFPFDPERIVTADPNGHILVPRAAEDDLFLPERVIRPTRGSAGISITVGPKGQERQYHDFYEALTALAAMDVARWRRPNQAGNWGIVRARGAWVAVGKAEIDRQIGAKQGAVL